MEELSEHQKFLKLVEEKLKRDNAPVSLDGTVNPGMPGSGQGREDGCSPGVSEEAAMGAGGGERGASPVETAAKPPDEMFDSWDEFIRD